MSHSSDALVLLLRHGTGSSTPTEGTDGKTDEAEAKEPETHCIPDHHAEPGEGEAEAKAADGVGATPPPVKRQVSFWDFEEGTVKTDQTSDLFTGGR